MCGEMIIVFVMSRMFASHTMISVDWFELYRGRVKLTKIRKRKMGLNSF